MVNIALPTGEYTLSVTLWDAEGRKLCAIPALTEIILDRSTERGHRDHIVDKEEHLT